MRWRRKRNIEPVQEDEPSEETSLEPATAELRDAVENLRKALDEDEPPP